MGKKKNVYITEVSENIYKFNLKEFLDTQGLIYYKFELESKGIDLIDKYLFQILEEIHEVNIVHILVLTVLIMIKSIFMIGIKYCGVRI